MSPSGETADSRRSSVRKEDYQHYLELMEQFCRAEQVAIWAYCLMPNQVHLIVVPQSAERACIAPSARHIAGTRGGSTSGRAGEGTCGKAASPRSSWMKTTSCPRRGTWSSTPCAPDWSRHQAVIAGAARRLT